MPGRAISQALKLLVPGLADYAFVHVEREGELALGAARHRDPGLVPLLSRLLVEARERMTAPGTTIDRVFRDGVPRVSQAGRGRFRSDRGGTSIVDILGPRSYLAVPLNRDGGRWGVLTLARFETPRPYRLEDLPAAEVVAAQIAMLMEAAEREVSKEEQIEDLADALIGVRESLAGELAAARDGLSRARRERDALDEARAAAERAAEEAEAARIAAEEALSNRSSELATTILDAVGDAVVATDAAGRVTYWNRMAEQIYGRPRDAMVGVELEAAAAELWPDEVAEQVLSGEPWSTSVRLSREGSSIEVALTVAAVSDEEGPSAGLVIVTSPRREPRDSTPEGGRKEGARPVTTSGEALDSGVTVGLNEVIDRVEVAVRDRLRAGVTLEVSRRADPDRVRLKPAALERAVIGLVLGAQVGDPELRRVSIRSENVGVSDADAQSASGSSRPFVALVVQDDGMGGVLRADDGDVDDAPVYPVRRSRDVRTLRDVIHDNGGRMSVASSPSQGTTVRVLFPLAGAGISEPTSRDTPSEGTPDKTTVLLVEDDESVRSMAARVLEGRGYDVVEARDGVEALRLWEEVRDRVSLVLTDVVMPRMSGRALVDRLRTQRPGVRALFLSEVPDEVVVLHGLTRARDPHLTKPFTAEQLSEAIGDALVRTPAGPLA